MIEIDFNPSTEKLRQFGWISMIGFGLIGGITGLKFGWFANGEWLIPCILWGIGLLAALLSLINPSLVKPLYLLLTAISVVTAPVISTVIIGLIFLLVFLPIGLIFRVIRRDGLQREIDPKADSYWSSRPAPNPPQRYFHQF